MHYVDPHIHMVSRITDDYETLARMGCVAVSEPAFWAGFDRRSADGFRDYFRQITEVEPKRAATYGIAHYSWLCINAKEAEDVKLAREVIAAIPEFLNAANVLGIGEIGLNKNTRNEATVFMEQVELAIRHDETILIHTPHLADKLRGTRMIIDMLADFPNLDRGRVVIDHVEEHTIRHALEAGYWAGMTLYPVTKCSPERACDMVELFGAERLLVNSAGDWGPSRPVAVPDFIVAMRSRGHAESLIEKLVLDNPLALFSRCRRYVPPPRVAGRGPSGPRPAP
jgi:predicted metal-dependent TIM-barrel fold hydrolase